MTQRPREPRSFQTQDPADSVLETLKAKIEVLRRRKRTYRALVEREEADKRQGDPDA